MKIFLCLIFLVVVSLNLTAQVKEVEKLCNETENYISETNDFLQDFNENVRKAQNAAFIQDVNLYLDIAFLSFFTCQKNISYTIDNLREIIKITDKNNLNEIAIIAGKAMNEATITENDFSGIQNIADELNGLSDFMLIQQRLSLIRNKTDSAILHLLELNMQINKLLNYLGNKENEE